MTANSSDNRHEGAGRPREVREPEPKHKPSQKRTPSTSDRTEYTPTPGSLLQRGNYSLLRMLTIVNAAGKEGLTTSALLESIGSKADRTNAIIRAAAQLGYIERVTGESEHGHFKPIYNRITDKGKKILQSALQ